jgi:FtsP/CotA-like multicopper oxidase with cupredoxin domain
MQSDALGGDAGDVSYPMHLLNGRPPAARPTFEAAPGSRVRLRIVNAGSDTAYRFAIGGHRLTVTHTDGYPVAPVDVDTLIVGMAERYDVIVQPKSGAWPVAASAEGKGDGLAAAVLRTTDVPTAAAPPPDTRPAELKGQLLDDNELKADQSVVLRPHKTDRTHHVALTLADNAYRWMINGKVHTETGSHGAELAVSEGERVRLEYENRTTMWHPMHLHGHTFERVGGGPRKDTIKVLPGQTIAVVFDADNPGQWMLHCHNTYHLMSGMGSVVSYT